MKAVAILFVLICASTSINAQAPPPSVDNLFSQSWEMQQRLSPRQQLVDSEVTELRESLTSVLDVHTGEAMREIENNTRQVVELELPYRVILTSLPDSACKLNLLRSLSLHTDFTGFKSAICVNRYQSSSDAIVEGAQDFIALYEGLFVRLQKVVVESYRNHNAFSQQTEILERHGSEYARRLDEWDAIRPQAEDFEANLNTAMTETHTTMEGCMLQVRDEAVIEYESILTRVPTCEEFDS